MCITGATVLCGVRKEYLMMLFAGWFHLQSDNRTIDGKEKVQRSGVCVTNYQGAKYLPQDLGSHVTATAVCVGGPAATHEMSTKKPLNYGRGRQWVWKLLVSIGVLLALLALGSLLFFVYRQRQTNVRILCHQSNGFAAQSGMHLCMSILCIAMSCKRTIMG